MKTDKKNAVCGPSDDDIVIEFCVRKGTQIIKASLPIDASGVEVTATTAIYARISPKELNEKVNRLVETLCSKI